MTHSSETDKASRRRALDFRKYTKQIWLAGLGAFSRAEEEGNRLFDTLVQAGAELESRAPSPADAKTAGHPSPQREDDGRDLENPTGRVWSERVQNAPEWLEKWLDDALQHTMGRLGLATSREVQQLHQLVDQLQVQVTQLGSDIAALGASRSPSKKSRQAP